MHGLPFIRLDRRKFKRAAIIAAGLLTVFTLVVVFLCGWLGIRSRMDVMGYYAMMQGHYHPVWKDLAWRRIRKGDSVESLLQRHPPWRRLDYRRYTELRYGGSFDGLAVWAKDGKLIAAAVGSRGWRHEFFTTPAEEKAVDAAYSAYIEQKMLEDQAFRIHRAITGGQDVFFARLIESHEVPYDWDEDIMQQLRKIYGQEYFDAMEKPTRLEFTVEVTKVLYGDLQVGTILTLPDDDCDVRPGGPEAVFLHFDDSRLIYPQHKAREMCSAVPRKALDWYQSLMPDQVTDLEARRLAEWAKRASIMGIGGTAGEGP